MSVPKLKKTGDKVSDQSNYILILSRVLAAIRTNV